MFYKVSLQQYMESRGEDSRCANEYKDIKLPCRATAGSAGYDFYAPFDFTIGAGEDIKIPTGVGVMLDQNKMLACFPRSGLGFKYKLQLANTVGIIDSDYSKADNEGHIYAKLVNNGNSVVSVRAGDAFMQGIILPFFTTNDDESNSVRTGGFGSTDS